MTEVVVQVNPLNGFWIMVNLSDRCTVQQLAEEAEANASRCWNLQSLPFFSFFFFPRLKTWTPFFNSSEAPLIFKSHLLEKI